MHDAPIIIPAPIVAILVLSLYGLIGYITYHVGKLYALYMAFMESWGTRTKMTDSDWKDSFNCYNVFGSGMFAMEPLFAFFWPIGVGIMLLHGPWLVLYRGWQRYFSESSLKKLNSQYRLRPSWLSRTSFLKFLNRFI